MNIVAYHNSECDCPFTVEKTHHYFITERFKVKRIKDHFETIGLLRIDEPIVDLKNVILLYTKNFKKAMLIDAETKQAIGLVYGENSFCCQTFF